MFISRLQLITWDGPKKMYVILLLPNCGTAKFQIPHGPVKKPEMLNLQLYMPCSSLMDG